MSAGYFSAYFFGAWYFSTEIHPPSPIRVFAVCMKRAWVLSYPLSAQRRLIDWADAQSDLSLRWAHRHFVGFIMRRLKGLLRSQRCEKQVTSPREPAWISLFFTIIQVSDCFAPRQLNSRWQQDCSCVFQIYDTFIEFDPHVGNILSWRHVHENISTTILPLPLIQEEQLSVTGERMCTKYW